MGILDILRILAAILTLVVAILGPLEKKDQHSQDTPKTLDQSEEVKSK